MFSGLGLEIMLDLASDCAFSGSKKSSMIRKSTEVLLFDYRVVD